MTVSEVPVRKSALSIALIAFMSASLCELYAGTLAGVTLPDSVQVGSTMLVLNGLGLRKKVIVKVYVAGLYLTEKTSDSNAILKADSPKRIVMHFVRGVSKSQMTDAFEESFENNAPDAARTAKPDIDRFLASLPDVKEADEMVFTYAPGQGTTFSINGQDRITILSPVFAQALFSVWLGPKPPNEDLKKGILGQ